jgi:hypothetical protein
MKSLFDIEAVEEVISRVDKLGPSTARQWGKMDVAQMMAHCSAGFDMASGRLVRPRPLIGRLIGPFLNRFIAMTNHFHEILLPTISCEFLANEILLVRKNSSRF